MAGIAGCWLTGYGIDPQTKCRVLLDACASSGDEQLSLGGDGIAVLGNVLHRWLPEDRYDRQPVRLAGRSGLLVFDGRIDNRNALAERLDLGRDRHTQLSDGSLVGLAWDRWGMESVDRIVGDYALGVWNARSRKLTLMRGPLSSRSLFYSRGASATAFASTPAALLHGGDVRAEIDEEALLNVLAGGTYVGTAGSVFRSISAVRPGHAVELTSIGECEFRIWEPPTEPGRWRSIFECGEALRAQLDGAVAAQLRRAEGKVASHLSSGRDSGAVAATAAMLMARTGEELLAYTGAPLEGFAEQVPPALLVDEAALARRTASLHPGMRQRICRSLDKSALEWLDDMQQVQCAPMLTPSNLPWWVAVGSGAAQDGASILLTGQAGNFSVSAGGPSALRNLAHEGAWREFLAGSRRFAGGQSGVRNSLTRIAGPVMPAWLYGALRSVLGRAPQGEDRLPLLRPPWRARAEALRQQRTADRRPPASYRQFLQQSLVGIDNAERMSAALFGLDVRDPTADRRLVEMVCSFPATAWYGNSDRPAFEAAFRDRLPAEVIHSRNRAYQQSDWFIQFDPEEVRRAFHDHARHPFVGALIDLVEVDRMVDAWPAGTGWMADPKRFAWVEDEYRNKLLPTLAVAAFIARQIPA